MQNHFSQTRALVNFYLRKDWLLLMIWWLVIGGLNIIIGLIYNGMYGSANNIKTIVQTLKTPAMASMFGVLPETQTYTTFDTGVGEMLVFSVIMLFIMNIQLIIKNTRGEEDKGTVELIRGLAVGRVAQISAVLIEAVLVNGLIALAGLTYLNLHGATINAVALFVGLLFAGGLLSVALSLFVAQIAGSARLATGITYFIFAAMYLVRMITDVINPDYTWWSPFGWIEKGAIGHGNDWLPFGILLTTGLIIIAGSVQLAINRDLGTGLINIDHGRRTAPVTLRGWLSLQWYLERTAVITWMFGLFILGASYGSIFNEVKQLVTQNDTLRQLLGSDIIHTLGQKLVLTFLQTVSIMPFSISIVAGLSLIFRAQTDIARGVIDLVIATPLSRTRMFIGYIGGGISLATLGWVTAVYSLYLAQAAVTQTPIAIAKFNELAVNQWPGILLFIGLATFLLGWSPRWRYVTYVILGINFYMMYLGKLLKVPTNVIEMMPSAWIAKVPVQTIAWQPWWLTLLVAIILILAGFMGYRRRDFVI